MNAPMEPLPKISPLERYQVFRNRIEHEDNLISVWPETRVFEKGQCAGDRRRRNGG